MIRLAPTVHGPGDYGFVAMLVGTARRTGVSAYVGDGANRWPAIHRLDAATLFRLALEKAPAGTALHGAAEGGVPLRAIAEKIGRTLDLPVVSVGSEEAASHFGSAALAAVFAADVRSPARAPASCSADPEPPHTARRPRTRRLFRRRGSSLSRRPQTYRDVVSPRPFGSRADPQRKTNR